MDQKNIEQTVNIQKDKNIGWSVLYKLIVISFLGAVAFMAHLVNLSTHSITSSAFLKNKEDCNIILISVDTLRADHVSCYGYYRNTTPNICKLAKESILFKNTYSQAPWTLASHTSMLTSLYLSQHKASLRARLSDNLITLQEILKNRGYLTAAFVSGAQLMEKYNLDQGFDVYYDALIGFGAQSVNKVASKWLEDNTHKKFFLFVHYIYPHHPYEPPERFDYFGPEDIQNSIPKSDRFSYKQITGFLRGIGSGETSVTNKTFNRIVGLYDGDIRYTDYYVGRLLNKISKLGLEDKTLIVFTSDHGEEFLEHNGMLHGGRLYSEQIKVPLIFKFPKSEDAKRITNKVRLIDIAPTILDFLNVSTNWKVEGESLLKILKTNKTEDRIIFSETRRDSKGKKSIISEKWKYIINLGNREEEIYNLDVDLKEENNLIKTGEGKKIVNRLKVKLFSQYFSSDTHKGSKEFNLHQRVRKRLRDLGYLSRF